MEREPEQPSLAAGLDEVADVEERGAAALAALEHVNDAALLGDVEAARLALRAGDEDRLREAACDRARLELRPLRRGAGGTGGDERGEAGEGEQRPHRGHDSQRIDRLGQ